MLGPGAGWKTEATVTFLSKPETEKGTPLDVTNYYSRNLPEGSVWQKQRF